ncbi:MAG: hypothetical protein LBK67_13215 [Coriobacteriales bacterium]|nr:hypothetical protein [Coriobacteriales bacterium]
MNDSHQNKNKKAPISGYVKKQEATLQGRLQRYEQGETEAGKEKNRRRAVWLIAIAMLVLVGYAIASLLTNSEKYEPTTIVIVVGFLLFMGILIYKTIKRE